MTMKTILIVDDEENVWQSIRRALRNEPYHVIGASSAKEALQMLSEKNVDVIVSDEMMPEHKGHELLKMCREKYPNVIRILITGQGSASTALDAIYDGGVFHFLEKPVIARRLLQIIQAALAIQNEQKEFASGNVVMSIESQRALFEKYGVEVKTDPDLFDGVSLL